MDYKAEQKKFDGIKWDDSMRAGRDLCGTYEFCVCCDKELKNPCARAADRYAGGYIRIALLRPRAGGNIPAGEIVADGGESDFPEEECAAEA